MKELLLILIVGLVAVAVSLLFPSPEWAVEQQKDKAESIGVEMI